MKRSAGVLQPVASLPGPYGSGDLGPSADRWIKFLHQAGFNSWAILPLLIPDSVGSPYASPSALAGNWLLISPERLFNDGLLFRHDLPVRINPPRINIHKLNRLKRHVVGLAWVKFAQAADHLQQDFNNFQKENTWWLNDYCLYMAIKDRQHGLPWNKWPAGLRQADPAALRLFTKRYQRDFGYFAFGQWLFDRQWQRVKRLVNESGIQIIGDLPFSVALDNVDVWRFKRFFKINDRGQPTQVLGAPPDALNRAGQNWGMPAYNWSNLAAEKFCWWIARFKRANYLYDLVRLDHFRGYVANWEIPMPSRNSRSGKWVTVPGQKMFQRVKQILGKLPCLAEDLGVITDEINEFRRTIGLPGMRILQFGFDLPKPSYHHPSLYPVNSVAYSGTHDLPPLKAWLSRIPSSIRRRLPTDLLKTLLQAKSWLVIIQSQDLFNLGASAQLNRPGTTRGNWTWRLSARWLTIRAAKTLRRKIKTSGRL